MLQKKFIAAALKYSHDLPLSERLWNELDAMYGAPQRRFHNWNHVEHLLNELEPFRQEVEDWDSLTFAAFYHDAAHDAEQYTVKNDNEERSAELAEKHLTAINFPQERLERSKAHILATKKHKHSDDDDTNLLLDADLSILGQPWPVYKEYSKAIREEYSVYVDSIFRSGRLHVLKHFLRMDPIYKTASFQEKYEATAKENMQTEIDLLAAV